MNSFNAIIREINLENWTEEGIQGVTIAAKVIDSLDKVFGVEDIEAFNEFIEFDPHAHIILSRLLGKKLSILKNDKNYPERVPLILR